MNSAANPRIASDGGGATAKSLIELAAGVWCGVQDTFDGLLLTGCDARANQLLSAAIERNTAVLALGDGFVLLNKRLGGLERSNESVANDNPEVFIAPGTKLTASVGGSGWLTVAPSPATNIALSAVAPAALASCWNRQMAVFGIEGKGRSWIVGLGWNAEQIADLPKGFTNLFYSLVGKSAEIGKQGSALKR